MTDADAWKLVLIVERLGVLGGNVQLCATCPKAHVTVVVDEEDPRSAVELIDELRRMHREAFDARSLAHAEYGITRGRTTFWEGTIRGWPSSCRKRP
jgi:hypothetical protein